MTKNLALAGVVALVVSLGVCALFPKQVQQVVQQLGSVTSQDFSQPYYSVAGVNFYEESRPLMASTTDLCIIKNPFATSTLVSAGLSVFTNPVGTVVYDLSTTTIALNGGNGSSTPQFVTSATLTGGAQAYQPWTPLASTTLSQTANVKGTWGLVQDPGTLVSGATPLGLGVTSGFVLKPGEALTWRIATSATTYSGTTFITGRCSAKFRQL